VKESPFWASPIDSPARFRPHMFCRHKSCFISPTKWRPPGRAPKSASRSVTWSPTKWEFSRRLRCESPSNSAIWSSLEVPEPKKRGSAGSGRGSATACQLWPRGLFARLTSTRARAAAAGPQAEAACACGGGSSSGVGGCRWLRKAGRHGRRTEDLGGPKSTGLKP
jgi:hypothetical protein